MHLPPQPTSINTPLLCSLSFLKNPVCESFFFGCGWALQKIFYLAVLEGDSTCFTLPTNALYRALQKRRVRKGTIHLRMGSCFISKKKNRCFEILLWSEKPFVLDTGKKAAVVQKPCLTQKPLSPPKLPLQCSVYLTVVTISPHPLQLKHIDSLHCLLMGFYGLMWHRQF